MPILPSTRSLSQGIRAQPESFVTVLDAAPATDADRHRIVVGTAPRAHAVHPMRFPLRAPIP
jgi:hypothetical protein